MAAAIKVQLCARVTAVAMSTASQPHSMASAASLAVPIPASTMTGTSACSTISSRLWGFRMPSPEPIGAAKGITAAQPTCSRRRANTGSSLVYGSTVNPSSTRSSAASRSSTGSGSSVCSSAITSSLTQDVSSASRPRRAVRTASVAGKQPAVLGGALQRAPGRSRRGPAQGGGAYGVGGGEAAGGVGQCPDLVALQNLPLRAFLGGGDVSHRDGGQFRLGSDESLLEHVERGGSPG